MVLHGREETIDLLALFAEDRVQRSPNDLRRNREIFEEIEKAMAAKGHRWSWQECRSQTKALKHLYKKAQLHNNTSDDAPYYKELHATYRDNRTINLIKVVNSFELNITQPGDGQRSEAEELITLRLTPISPEMTSEDFFPQTQYSCKHIKKSYLLPIPWWHSQSYIPRVPYP